MGVACEDPRLFKDLKNFRLNVYLLGKVLAHLKSLLHSLALAVFVVHRGTFHWDSVKHIMF